MKKTQPDQLGSASPDELVEGFVRESKLVELSDVPAADRHLDAALAYAEEIRTRGGLPSLAPLMDGPDPYIAYSVARLLLKEDGLRDRALAALDRIVEAKAGEASFRANIARNVARHGRPSGPSTERV